MSVSGERQRSPGTQGGWKALGGCLSCRSPAFWEGPAWLELGATEWLGRPVSTWAGAAAERPSPGTCNHCQETHTPMGAAGRRPAGPRTLLAPPTKGYTVPGCGREQSSEPSQMSAGSRPGGGAQGGPGAPAARGCPAPSPAPAAARGHPLLATLQKTRPRQAGSPTGTGARLPRLPCGRGSCWGGGPALPPAPCGAPAFPASPERGPQGTAAQSSAHQGSGDRGGPGAGGEGRGLHSAQKDQQPPASVPPSEPPVCRTREAGSACEQQGPDGALEPVSPAPSWGPLGGRSSRTQPPAHRGSRVGPQAGHGGPAPPSVARGGRRWGPAGLVKQVQRLLPEGRVDKLSSLRLPAHLC